MNLEIDQQVNEDTLFLEPRESYDDCIIGITYDGSKVIYDATKIMDVLMSIDDMTDEEALEFFEYNILGSYVGENTPIYVVNLRSEEDEDVD